MTLGLDRQCPLSADFVEKVVAFFAGALEAISGAVESLMVSLL